MNFNGRVNISGYNPDARFQLYDRIPAGNNNTGYQEALTGNWSSNKLSNQFFSKQNIENLQQLMKRGVYQRSNGKIQIGNQDEDTLKIIMRSIFLQHSTNLPFDIDGQVKAINKLVLDYSIPQLCSEARAYIKYKHDVSTLVTPIQRPVSTYKDQSLEFKGWF